MDARFIRLAGAAAVLGLIASCGGGGGTTVPAPTPTGTVSGTVTADGNALAGAQVALPGKGTQTTSSTGAFTFTQVATGTHTLTLTMPANHELGTGETLQKPVTVTAGQTATIGWSLRRVTATTVTTDTVRLSGTSFSPSRLTVKVGSTVVWVNTNSTFHTVTPDGHTQWARAETSGAGEVTRATLNAAGEFDYFCEPHQSQGMTGEIVVQP